MLNTIASAEDNKITPKELISRLRRTGEDSAQSDAGSKLRTCLIATGDTTWARRVTEALTMLRSKDAAPLFNDVCGARLSTGALVSGDQYIKGLEPIESLEFR